MMILLSTCTSASEDDVDIEAYDVYTLCPVFSHCIITLLYAISSSLSFSPFSTNASITLSHVLSGMLSALS